LEDTRFPAVILQLEYLVQLLSNGKLKSWTTWG
jgi:hypothetical protein